MSSLSTMIDFHVFIASLINSCKMCSPLSLNDKLTQHKNKPLSRITVMTK